MPFRSMTEEINTGAHPEMNDTPKNKMASYTDRMKSLTPGKSGNYSLRRENEIYITPSGLSYSELTPETFPKLTLDGHCKSEQYHPSSESDMHCKIYRTFSARAIVHTHSPWATTLAALEEPLSFVHYAAAIAGDEVPLADYATYGTGELAQNVVHALQTSNSKACLMKNHGLICYGGSLENAFDIVEAVEFTARIECQSRMVGTPQTLNEQQIQKAAKQFDSYGQNEV